MLYIANALINLGKSKLKRRVFSILIYSVACVFLTACTINPTMFGAVNGEYKGDITVDIVKKVRCEARDAMVHLAAGLMELELDEKDRLELGAITNENLKSTVELLKKNPSEAKDLKLWDIPIASQVISTLFLSSKVAHNFDIKIKETNTNSVDPGFTASHGLHEWKLGLGKQSFTGARQNQRKLDLPVAQFSAYRTLDCSDAIQHKVPDFVYPLRGNIGIFKSVKSFIDFVHLGTTHSQRREMAIKAFEAGAVDAYSRRAEENEKIKLALVGKKYEPPSNWKKMRIEAALASYQTLSQCTDAQIKTPNSTCQKTNACLKVIHERAALHYRNSLYGAAGYRGIGVATKATFSEILTFTTTIDSGIAPSVTFSPTAALSLKTLAFSLVPQRLDTHMLTTNFIAADKLSKIPYIFRKTVSTEAKIPLSKAKGHPTIEKYVAVGKKKKAGKTYGEIFGILPVKVETQMDNKCEITIPGAPKLSAVGNSRKPKPGKRSRTNNVTPAEVIAPTEAFFVAPATEEELNNAQRAVERQNQQNRFDERQLKFDLIE